LVGYSAAAATLAAAFLIAAAMQLGHRFELIPPATVLGVCAVALAERKASSGTDRRQFLSVHKNLLAQLTPVVCLSLVYPLIGAQLAASRVGTVPVSAPLLATSLVVPWMSQIVSMPLFTALSTEPPSAQSPAPASTTAWIAYAVALMTAPTWWFLPPVAGLLTQLIYLATKRPVLTRLVGTRGIVEQPYQPLCQSGAFDDYCTSGTPGGSSTGTRPGSILRCWPSTTSGHTSRVAATHEP
jgi:hypothetical protein